MPQVWTGPRTIPKRVNGKSGCSAQVFKVVGNAREFWIGWCGCTTQRLAPSRLMANLIALVYNGWHLYARLYDRHAALSSASRNAQIPEQALVGISHPP